MNAVDTNVLIYRLDNRDPVKQSLACELIRQLTVDTEPTVLPWQVLGEFANQMRRWTDQERLTRDAALRYLASIRRLFPTQMPTSQVLDRALDLTDRYSLSHWDSMLLGACIEANVDTLFTEDMGAPINYGSVRLVNPFAST